MNEAPIIDDLDFGQMYRDHFERAGSPPKPAEFWDARAQAFDARVRAGGGYIDAFVSRVDLSGCRSLIDIGCGNGALTVALAKQLETAVALDYSPAMLEIARARAAEAGLADMTTVLRAWEEDWSDLPVCDIAIASRSIGVADLEAALQKLDRQARRRVYLTAPVGARIVNPSLVDALGRQPAPRIDKPDYIYIVNLLHRMNRMPKLDFIAHPGSEQPKADLESFERNAGFFLGELSEEERARLRAWRQANEDAPLFQSDWEHWAFISWSPC